MAYFCSPLSNYHQSEGTKNFPSLNQAPILIITNCWRRIRIYPCSLTTLASNTTVVCLLFLLGLSTK